MKIMGRLKRFNINRIQNQFETDFLFETGTWKGDSVAYALRFPFKKIFSSEIIVEIADTAKKRFEHNNNVEIINSNSTDAIKSASGKITSNCLFWLDAHFPGAEEGLKDHNEVTDENVKLPLYKEIEVIASRKNRYKDVILIDDLRIYEDGPFESGNIPDTILKPEIRHTNFINDIFSETHVIIKSYADEGYILILPKENFARRTLFYPYYMLFNKVFKKIY
jgi:hypothetical protein